MAAALQTDALLISADALCRMMPMHIRLSADGRIAGVGPTLAKLMSGQGVAGRPFFSLFEVRRPGGIGDLAALTRWVGQPMHLRLRLAPDTTLRGLAVRLADDNGLLLNLSFGSSVTDAVRAHDLTDSDFAPTDLAMELLYVVEAKTAVMKELRDLNHRLEGAKTAAEEQALTDTLTGLRNRRALDLAMAQVIVRNMPFGLMHMDLDYFKSVNDTLGHAAGDAVLREVGRILRGQTRDADTIARTGGDEFVILLPGLVDATVLWTIAGRIIAQLDQPILHEGRACRVSASIGMTVSTTYSQAQPDRMMADADDALYEAKRAGRGRAVFRTYTG
ncbi:MAG: diguanylate cyclase [Rhodobacter sp.]|jgi:diguanylate cyclase (GGDEF)-like protein|nr:diguanylate cyclase [Rhodobacter sp.]